MILRKKKINDSGANGLNKLIPVTGTLTGKSEKAWCILTDADGITRYPPFSICEIVGNPMIGDSCTILMPVSMLERSKGGYPQWVTDMQLPITYTLFNGLKVQQGVQVTATWFDFCQLIKDVPDYAAKNDQPLVKLATFDNDTRASGSNLSKVYGLELDYDDGEIEPDLAAAQLEDAGIRAIICSTFTSAPDKPKWRAFLPLSRGINPMYRAALVAAADGVLGGVVASESFVEKQIFFIGRSGDQYQVLESAGEPINTVQAMKVSARAFFDKQEAQAEKEEAALTQVKAETMKRAKLEKLIDGQVSVIDSFNEAYDIHTLLQNHGYLKKGKRYKAPSSRSGMAGINVLMGDDGKERVYSHHGNDPLNISRAVDAFDVYCLLEHGGDNWKAIQAAAHLISVSGGTLHHHNRMVWRKQKAAKAAQTMAGRAA